MMYNREFPAEFRDDEVARALSVTLPIHPRLIGHNMNSVLRLGWMKYPYDSVALINISQHWNGKKSCGKIRVLMQRPIYNLELSTTIAETKSDGAPGPWRLVVMICAMLSASCSGQYLSQHNQGNPGLGGMMSAPPAYAGQSQQGPSSSSSSPSFAPVDQSSSQQQQASPAALASSGFISGVAAPATTQQICTCITVSPSSAASAGSSAQQSASAPLTDSFAPAAQQQQTFAAPQQQQQQSFAAPQQSFVAPAQQQAYAPAQSGPAQSGNGRARLRWTFEIESCARRFYIKESSLASEAASPSNDQGDDTTHHRPSSSMFDV
ncbi:hypothetical protein DAPPUDRAFT_240366 [Daphnia pulex]|uniref:Uncharacterized protein n=1 Tax=Daphnia pulex TaxID=6669 RepID=E9GBF0_DAPPU|nr:hypothetical protein DAPPUDRAFT_240366 [Daphnia pulex]|eukprot:EFX83168.1 hypothetical protein DAPPUDRAFT_240366 [Daphnia pulex]